ncbi:MAG: alanine--glyoxylate aminotransferase family protein [Bdellovibrionota bacterium]|nr:alanine--glyoxylate aminotransferase family protein [Bdellovibrionota bacterium]
MSNSNRPLLVAPGPVEIPETALKAFASDIVHHRTPEFTRSLVSARGLLKKTLKTDREVYMFCSTGSGAMEAAVVNFLDPNDKSLVIVSGKFGQRWADMLKIYGANVDLVCLENGDSMSLQMLEEKLKANNYQSVYCQMCETSTGAYHPIEEMGPMIKNFQNDCLFIVDGITGLLTKELDLQASKVDVMVAGSQKAFMLPTGMSFLWMSELAEKKCESARCPRYYWDLRREKKAIAKDQTAFSTASNLVFALEAALGYILETGLDNHYAEIAWRAESCRKLVSNLGLQVLAKTPAPALTAICMPDKIDGKKLRQKIEDDCRVVFMGGQDELTGKIIRIGHIGDLSRKEYSRALKAFASEYMSFAGGYNKEQQEQILSELDYE